MQILLGIMEIPGLEDAIIITLAGLFFLKRGKKFLKSFQHFLCPVLKYFYSNIQEKLLWSPNQRMIATQDAQEFQDLLLAKTEVLISNYLVISTTSKPSTTSEVSTTTSEFSSTSEVVTTTSPSQSPGLVLISLFINFFIIILWRRSKKNPKNK